MVTLAETASAESPSLSVSARNAFSFPATAFGTSFMLSPLRSLLQSASSVHASESCSRPMPPAVALDQRESELAAERVAGLRQVAAGDEPVRAFAARGRRNTRTPRTCRRAFPGWSFASPRDLVEVFVQLEQRAPVAARAGCRCIVLGDFASASWYCLARTSYIRRPSPKSLSRSSRVGEFRHLFLGEAVGNCARPVRRASCPACRDDLREKVLPPAWPRRWRRRHGRS